MSIAKRVDYASWRKSALGNRRQVLRRVLPLPPQRMT